MTTIDDVLSVPRREARPFLYLTPTRTRAAEPPVEARGLELLNEAVGHQVPVLVRALVDFTIEARNQDNRRSGVGQAIAMSVLNRRRRSARAWILAVLEGDIGEAALQSFNRTWMPQLAGTGPDIVRAAGTGRRCIEYLRGAVTALIFDRPAGNLLPQACALHALETTLGVYLRSFREAVQQDISSPRV